MSDNIARQPKGRPTGGQFAATGKSESELDSLSEQTEPDVGEAIAAYRADSNVFRPWTKIHGDHRSVTDDGQRMVLALDRRTGTTVLTPHLGPEWLEHWYATQAVFGPGRPAAAAKAIRDYHQAKADREDRPWDDDSWQRLIHATRIRIQYSEYGDTYIGD